MCKIAIITAGDAIDRYIINELRREFDIKIVIEFYDSQKPQSRNFTQFFSKSKIYYLLRSWYLNLYEQRIESHCQKALNPGAVTSIKSIAAREINSAETANRLKELDVDYLLLLGAPVLKENIFSIPRLGTINLHYGITPKYRGGYTLFWPFYFNDTRGAGFTLHWVNQGIDTGSVIAQGFPKLSSSAQEKHLTAGCARLALTAIKEIFKNRIDRNTKLASEYRHQPDQFFRYSDRHLKHDILLFFRRLLRPSSFERKSDRLEFCFKN